MIDTLALPDAPAIAGLTFRRFGAPEDWAAMAKVVQDASLHDDNDWVPDPKSLRVEFETTTDLVPTRDILLAEVDGRLVAWAHVMRQVRDGLSTYTSTGTVHPDWRRRGIGRALLRANERHNRELAAQFDDPGGRVFNSWAGEQEGGAFQLLASEGYTPVRYGFSMIRRSLDDIPAAPLRDGLEIRAVREEHHRAIFEADNEAFRDHWAHREFTDDDFRGLFTTPDFDPTLWVVAWDGDQVVGGVQTFIWKQENETLGVRRGWLEHISVRRPWRRRGVAKAIIAEALRRLRAAGMTEAMLGVDSENPSGALQLYESLGFEVKHRGATFRKPWEPGGRLV